MKLRQYLLGGFVCSIVIVIVFLLSERRSANLSMASAKTENVAKAGAKMDTNALTETLDIPIYPGAWQTAVETERKPYGFTYLFSANAVAADVATFYKNSLTSVGWVLIGEHSSDHGMVLAFSLTGSSKQVSLRRYTEISLFQVTDRVDILAKIERWPDANQVPLYPNAVQVTTHLRTDSEFGNKEHVVAYYTNASIAEIEAYYKIALVEQGWSLNNPLSNPLVFSYWRSTGVLSGSSTIASPGDAGGRINKRIGTSSLIKVYTQLDKDGQTKVEIRVSGDEVKPPAGNGNP